MTDRDQGVVALLFFVTGWIASYIAHYVIPPRSRRRAAITGALVGAALPGCAAAVACLAGVRFPLLFLLILMFCSTVLGLVNGRRGFLDAPRPMTGGRALLRGLGRG